MDLFDRVFRLHQILRRARYPVGRALLQERLECSRATLARMLREMKDYLGAPIEYDRRAGGYRYASTPDGPYELPGLWFTASELYALLVAQQLLAAAQPGLLDEELKPLRDRIEQLLGAKRMVPGDIARRIRILSQAARRTEPAAFQSVAHAVLGRKRLRFRYHGRGRDEVTQRSVSPQRLVHYRDNWYLDAWDHGKRALRTFAVERVREPRLLDECAKEIPEQRLDRYFAESYGIFAGRPNHKALLRFTPERARWVAEETWHPQQQGWFDVQGRTNVAGGGKPKATEGSWYYLEIPYSDDRELVLDILKHGADVEVLRPKSLRKKVLEQLLRAASQYRCGR